jgi:hypothetical protein
MSNTKYQDIMKEFDDSGAQKDYINNMTSITSLATVCSAVKADSDAQDESSDDNGANACSWGKMCINEMPKVYNQSDDSNMNDNMDDSFASLMTACSVVKSESNPDLLLVYVRDKKGWIYVNRKGITRVVDHNSGGSLRQTMILVDGKVIKHHHFSCRRAQLKKMCKSCIKGSKSKCTKGRDFLQM